jgi:hypothetical protein
MLNWVLMYMIHIILLNLKHKQINKHFFLNNNKLLNIQNIHTKQKSNYSKNTIII